MSQTATLVATGLIEFSGSTYTINVYADGVQIFINNDADEPIDIFTEEEDMPSGAGTGSMIFTNLLVPLQGKALPTEINLSAEDITIRIAAEQTAPSAPLSHLPNAHFSKYDLELSQTKDGPLVLGSASATMVLMGEEMILSGLLSTDGIDFQLASDSKPEAIILPHIGSADLKTVEVQTNVERWRDLQLLYSFNEGLGDLVYNRSGSNPPLKLTVKNSSWLPDGGLLIPKHSDDTEVKASTRKDISEILNEISTVNAFSVELWVKPLEAEPGTILAMGTSTDILFSLEQNPDETISTAGTFSSSILTGAAVVLGQINHIVFTHTSTEECLYVNGQQQKRTTPAGGSWLFNHPTVLSLGNNPAVTIPDSWLAEFHNLAIYSRALTEEEVLNELRPIVRTSGGFTIDRVPEPLNISYPNTKFDLTQEIASVEVAFQENLPFPGSTAFPEFQLSNLELRWEQTGPSSWQVSGGIDATFWRDKIALVASLIGSDEEARLSFSQQQSPVLLRLSDWARLEFTSLRLQVAIDPQLQWDLSTSSEPTFAILPRIHFRNFDPLADFMLLDHRLGLSSDRLLLIGSWLGESAISFESDRLPDDELLMYATTTFDMRAALKIPPIFDAETGVAINAGNVPEISGTHPSDQPQPNPSVNPQEVNIRLDLELSRNGLLTKVNSHFDWNDLEGVSQHTDLPEFTLYAPPPHKNALLGHIEGELHANLSTIFSEQGRNKEDYYLDLNAQGLPAIYLSETTSVPTQILSTLPRLFSSDPASAYQSPDPNVAPPIFKLEQTPTSCELTINLSSSDTSTMVREAFQGLLNIVEGQHGLSGGGLRLLQNRIAERLPSDFANLLYYHYGWDITANYIDLHPGMRLRVDFQNYQFVHAIEQGAQSGFAGSGSTYLAINSYTHGDGHQYLGFDPFLSRLQTNNQANISMYGAAGLLDLVKVGARKAFFRLFFPDETSEAASPERAVTIVGAANWKDLPDTAPTEVDNSGTLISFYFRDKAMVIPEILVYIGNRAVYVPVGTTLRQLSEQYNNIPFAGQGETDLQAFTGNSRPRRLLHIDAGSHPAYRFLNLNSNGVAGNSDVFDLPLIKGDRFYF